jgi:hypothetical protein
VAAVALLVQRREAGGQSVLVSASADDFAARARHDMLQCYNSLVCRLRICIGGQNPLHNLYVKLRDEYIESN